MHDLSVSDRDDRTKAIVIGLASRRLPMHSIFQDEDTPISTSLAE
jgi:hypothetical protein